MNYLQKLEYWGESHHPKYVDILRIAFGIFLCAKGVEFANNTQALDQMIGSRASFNSFLQSLIVHYVLFAHIAGGFMIATGLLTRLACLVQIPILIGAFIFVRWDMMQHFSGIFLALITLVLLCYFLVVGSGPWSLDKVIENQQREEESR